jgi:DnaJ-class molecular chaperone
VESALERYRLYAMHCASLGLSPDTPFPEIKKRFRELALRFHPDKSGSPENDREFKRISRAYVALEKLRHLIARPYPKQL